MLIRNVLKTKSVLAMCAALTLSACGQNANVASKANNNAAGSTQSPVKSDGDGMKKNGNGPGAQATPTPTPTSKPLPTPTSKPTAPPSGGNQPAPTPVVTPTPTQTPVVIQTTTPAPVVVKGKDGDNGKDGNNGKDGRDGCGTVTVPEQTFSALPLEVSELDADDLPYVSTPRNKIVLKTLGQYNQVTPGGATFVQDAQVAFKIPVSLPPRESILKLNNAYIQMSLVKMVEDGYPDTELMCLIDQRVCSGKTYSQSTWQQNINQKFWDKKNGDMRPDFVDSLKANEIGRAHGGKLYGNDAFTIHLADLIKGSSYEDVLAMLYEDAPGKERINRELRIVVADDSLVKSAKLVLEYQEDTCRTFDLLGKQDSSGMAATKPAPKPQAKAAPAVTDAPSEMPGEAPGEAPEEGAIETPSLDPQDDQSVGVKPPVSAVTAKPSKKRGPSKIGPHGREYLEATD